MKKNYEEYNENELLERLKNDDQRAFVTIYNTYWKKLFVIGGNFLKDNQDVEECLQNIFVDIWNRRAQLKIEKGLEHYLAVSIKYQALNLLLKRKKQDELIKLIQNTIQYNTPEDVFLDKELEQILSQSINKLPTQCRLVFQLKNEEGLSILQIAETMSISKNTVKMHLKIANKKIRKDLLVLLPLLITLLSK